MLLGTTFAQFTDSVLNTGNRIESGDLKVDFYWFKWDSAANSFKQTGMNEWAGTGKMSADNWEPGQSDALLVRVDNMGSLAAKLQLSFDITEDSGLSDALWFRVTKRGPSYSDAISMPEVTGPVYRSDSRVTCMSELENQEDTFHTVLMSNETGVESEWRNWYLIEYGMYADAGNEYMNCTTNVDIHFDAAQATVEEDGFGSNQYDKDAEFAPTQVDAGNDAVSNGKALRSAIDNASENDVIVLDEGTYELDEALVFTKPLRIVGDGEAVLDLSNATAPIDGSYVTSAALFVASSNVTFEGVTIYGAEGLNSIVTVGFDNVGAAGLEDGNIKVSDDLSYDFEWAVNEFYPEYKGIYENVNFSNCTFALNDGASVAHGLFLNCRYAVIENCTFKNVNATSAIVKIEEDHTKVLGSSFENCTGIEIAEDWCGASDKGDGNEYPGHEFKCEEGWANLTGEEYEKHLAYAASLGWNHHAE